MPSSNENQVLNAVCDYLALKNHFFWRQNTTGVYDPAKKIFRKMPKYSMAGVSDVIVITDGGYAVFLEVKDKSKQSDTQKAFEAKCKEKGTEYHIIRNIDQLKEIGL